MSSVLKPLYGTANQALTCTLASLPGTSARQSVAINNSSNLFADVLVSMVGVSSVGGGTGVQLYVAGSVDGGATYTGGATGADAAMAIPSGAGNNPFKLLGAFAMPFGFNTYRGGPFSVASLFGGVLPQFFSIVVFNDSGGPLSSGALTYQSVQFQGV